MNYSANVPLGGKEILPADLARLRDFISRHRWWNAVTYVKFAPHQYVVKGKLPTFTDVVDFMWFVEFIRNNGFVAKFMSFSLPYLVVDEFYYWSMGALVEKTIVLNRAKLSNYTLINGVIKFKGATRKALAKKQMCLFRDEKIIENEEPEEPTEPDKFQE